MSLISRLGGLRRTAPDTIQNLASRSTPSREGPIEQIGVDFGTSTLIVATATAGGTPSARRLTRLGSHLSSEIFAWWEDDALRATFSQLMTPTELVDKQPVRLSSVKRHFSCGAQCENPRGTEDWCAGNGVVVIAGRLVDLAVVVGTAIQRLLRNGHEELLTPSGPVVGACPVDWSLAARELMARAVSTGFDVPVRAGSLREEPVLAAKMLRITSGMDPGRYLVIDVGGGSTDVVIAEVGATGSGIEVLASEGDKWLGGDDFDAVLRAMVLNRLEVEESLLRPEEAYEFRRQVETAKRDLTNAYPDLDHVTITVSGFEERLTYSDLTSAWERSRFEESLERMALWSIYRMIQRVGLRNIPPDAVPLYHDAWAWKSHSGVLGSKIRQIPLSSALSEIDGLVLVGGGTALRQLRDWVERRFTTPTHGRIVVAARAYGDPVESVARGAASQVPVRGLSLFRLPYWLILMPPSGEPTVLVRPFADKLPSRPVNVGFQDYQPRLLVLDETMSEEFGSLTIDSGDFSFWFDELQRLHVRVSGGELEFPMPWHEGAMFEPIRDAREREQLERWVRLGELLKKPNYYDE